MSDFLQRLARRTIGLPEGVEPRLRTRFEPPARAIGFGPQVDGDDLESDAGSATSAEEQAAVLAHELLPARRRRPSSVRQTLVDFSERPSEDQSETLPRPQSRRDRPADQSAEPTPAAHRTLDTAPEPPEATPVASTPSESNNHVGTEVPAEPNDGSEDRRPGRADRQTTPPRGVAIDDGARPQEVHRHEVAEPRVRAAQPEPSIRPLGPLPGLPAPDHASATTSIESVAQPRITVSIGRVDVRAVFAPPPPVALPVQTGPTMQLEDYLERREGGRL